MSDPAAVQPSPRGGADSGVVAAAAAAELQQLLLASEDIGDFLTELAQLATAVLPGDISCGITLRRDRRPVTVASSDTRASQVDEIQYGHDHGPCLHTLRSGEVVVVEDLATDDRWGGYQMPALGHGVRSSLSLPLRVDHVVGAMNLYAYRPRVFGPSERASAARFAQEASRALALAVRIADRSEMSDHLQTALATRAVIDQALGVIMGQDRCTADEAFEVLRTISQNRNIKLHTVASEIITAVTGRPPASAPRFS
jgi:GAF domain-containing protein